MCLSASAPSKASQAATSFGSASAIAPHAVDDASLHTVLVVRRTEDSHSFSSIRCNLSFSSLDTEGGTGPGMSQLPTSFRVADANLRIKESVAGRKHIGQFMMYDCHTTFPRHPYTSLGVAEPFKVRARSSLFCNFSTHFGSMRYRWQFKSNCTPNNEKTWSGSPYDSPLFRTTFAESHLFRKISYFLTTCS
ncbi:hypothetical protein DIPPA_63844 [Diplonema papillatum]|nr:hypothetical protein DIPPA_63844 [Diplonema papillatum]